MSTREHLLMPVTQLLETRDGATKHPVKPPTTQKYRAPNVNGAEVGISLD